MASDLADLSIYQRNDTASRILGYDLRRLIDSNEKLSQTRYTPSSYFDINGYLSSLGENGITPDIVAGAFS